MEGTPQQPSVPANWYPDPNGEGLRYWDGTAWTTHTAPAAPAQPAAAPAQPAEKGPPPSSSAAKGASPTAAAKGGAPGSAVRQSPRSPAAAASDEPTTLEWVLSIALPLLPLIGLIWGIYLRSQGGAKETPGNVAILLSLALILLAVLTLR